MNHKVTYVGYRPGDIEALDLHDCFSQDTTVEARCLEIVESPFNMAYTILCPEGKPLAVFGGFFLYPGVMQLWALVDKRVEKYPKWYARAAKFIIHHEFERLNVKRMQVMMKADQPWALSWARYLGFEKECVLRNYGFEICDYFQFAMVRD